MRQLLLSITTIGRSYRFIRRLSGGKVAVCQGDNALILMERLLKGRIEPGVRSLDLKLPLGGVAEGYRAIDERRAIKVTLKV